MKSLCALAGMLILISCASKNADTAGATTETTNGLTLAATLSTGVKAARTQIVLYAQTNLQRVDSGMTDSNGILKLRLHSADSNFFVEAYTPDSVYMLWVGLQTVALHHDSGTIMLDSAASLTLYANPNPHGLTTLQGTPYKALGDSGIYHFAHLPAANYLLLTDTGSSAQALSFTDSVSLMPAEQKVIHQALAVDTTKVDTITIDTVPGFLLDNFDNGTGVNNLVAITKTAGWYLGTTLGAGWTQPASMGEIPKAIVTTNAWSGHSLSLIFNAGTAGGIATFGTHLGPDSMGYNLSKLKAVRIRLRGDARIEISLEQPRQIAPQQYRKVLWSLQLDSNWNDYSLQAGAEVVDSALYQASFASVVDSVGMFNIRCRSGSWLEVDDIRFEGIDSTAF